MPESILHDLLRLVETRYHEPEVYIVEAVTRCGKQPHLLLGVVLLEAAVGDREGRLDGAEIRADDLCVRVFLGLGRAHQKSETDPATCSTGVCGGGSPNWMAQMPVPVPMSSTYRGASVKGTKASFPPRSKRKLTCMMSKRSCSA